MHSIQTVSCVPQYLSKTSKEADHMKDYFQYVLMPFVDDLIENHAIKHPDSIAIQLDFVPLPEVIELTEHYFKARGCVSFSVLNALLQDRADELFFERKREAGLAVRYHRDNGEPYFVRQCA